MNMKNKAHQDLKQNRVKYEDIEWVSSKGRGTYIVDMSDDYLENVIKVVAAKLAAARHITWLEGANSYYGIEYTTWLDYFKNEYLYRQDLRKKGEYHSNEYDYDYDMVGMIDVYDFCD